MPSRLRTLTGNPTAHKLIYPVAGGEETVAHCPACGYAADPQGARLAAAVPSDEALRPMQAVETPDCKTIAELAGFLNIPTSRTAKAVFLVAHIAGEGDRFVFAVVRGDTALNETEVQGAAQRRYARPRDRGRDPSGRR